MSIDEEHSRSVFILSRSVDEYGTIGPYYFCIFTNGKVYELTNDLGKVLKSGIQIIPFFSPAFDTQFAIYDPHDESLKHESPDDTKLNRFTPKDGSIRVFEVSVDGAKVNLTKPFKILSKKLNRFIDNNQVHTMLCTDLDRNIILLTDSDMQVMDLTSADRISVVDKNSGDEVSQTIIVNHV